MTCYSHIMGDILIPSCSLKVSVETMRFIRGKYKLDEVPGKYYDIDCLKFRQGKKTILSFLDLFNNYPLARIH